MSEIFAVIDTETNYSNELMSIGIVVADSDTFEKIDEYYGIYDPAYKAYSMFGYVLRYKDVKIDKVASRNVISEDIVAFLEKHGVKKIFAYNAKFDYGHLRELQDYDWYDIMRLAAYKQYNSKITEDFDCCKTGRLKKHYGVEDIYRLLSGNYGYCEVHNALTDARDELEIMRYLGKSVEEYEVARVD